MALKWASKDPDEVLDYAINWDARIAEDDEITTSTWIVPTGITKNSDSFDADTSLAVIWLSGGALNKDYEFTNRIVTAGGRTMDQSVRLSIRKK